MLEHLQKTNPSERWLKGMFRTHLQMLKGEDLVVNFDLKSAGKLTLEGVMNAYGHLIYVDQENNYGEYLSIATTLTSVINEKMMEVVQEVFAQIKASWFILEDIEDQNYERAAQTAFQLGVSLLSFEPRASKVWCTWVDEVLEYTDSQEDAE